MKLDTVQLLLLQKSNEHTRPILLKYFESLHRAKESERAADRRMISILVKSLDLDEILGDVILYIGVYQRTGLQKAKPRGELLKVLRRLKL